MKPTWTHTWARQWRLTHEAEQRITALATRLGVSRHAALDAILRIEVDQDELATQVQAVLQQDVLDLAAWSREA
jgi:hypothetical protein